MRSHWLVFLFYTNPSNLGEEVQRRAAYIVLCDPRMSGYNCFPARRERSEVEYRNSLTLKILITKVN